MSRTRMRRAVNAEIRRETATIRWNLGKAKECRRKAEEYVRLGSSAGASAYLKLERDYMDVVDKEMRKIDGKTQIRDILENAAEDATDQQVIDAGTAEGMREVTLMKRLRDEADALTAAGTRLMEQGRVAQAVAKLHEAQQKLAEAQQESDVIYGKLLALIAMSQH